MRQCEYKKRYDPETGQYMKKHIYVEGIFDSIKSIRSKLFGRRTENAASKAASKSISKASEHAGEKAGDKIVELVCIGNRTTSSTIRD